jgi:hypothetical protein
MPAIVEQNRRRMQHGHAGICANPYYTGGGCFTFSLATYAPVRYFDIHNRHQAATTRRAVAAALVKRNHQRHSTPFSVKDDGGLPGAPEKILSTLALPLQSLNPQNDIVKQRHYVLPFNFLPESLLPYHKPAMVRFLARECDGYPLNFPWYSTTD